MAGQVRGYRLSAQQRRLWRLREQGHPSWARALVSIEGPVDAAALAAALDAALDAVVRRHEILRTSYREVPGSGTAVQVVADAGTRCVEWTTEDLGALGAERHRERVVAAARAQRGLPLAAGGPVVRAALFTRGPRRHTLVLTVPALAADVRTLRLLVEDLVACYAGTSRTDGDVLQYAQYAEWQHGLDEHAPPASPSADLPAFPLERAQGGGVVAADEISRPLPAATLAALRTRARALGVRPDALLLAAWQILLWKITEQAGVTVGVCFAGRGHEEMADCLGPFARWLGVRAEMTPETTFAALAAAVSRSLHVTEEGQEHVLTAYADPGSRWRTAFEYRPVAVANQAANAVFTLEGEDVEAEPYDLGLVCAVAETEATTLWRYRGTRFAADYVECLATQFLTLLARLLSDPAAPVRAVNPLDTATSARLLADFNAPAAPNPERSRCLPRLFEEQVGRTPDVPAVVDGGQSLTYAALDARANRLARALRARGVGREDRVAVCAAHSVNLVVALLAVLKSGGAYLPLDPETPWRRNRRLSVRAGCRILVTDDASVFGWDGSVLNLDRLPPDVATADAGAPDPVAGPDDLAYVMYTSGSTGSPKGVMLPHRALANYVRWAADAYLNERGDATPMHSSIAFDLTVTSVFAPLITGRTVRVDSAWREVRALAAELGSGRSLELVKLTPAHLEVINHELPDEVLPRVTRTLVLGGEALSMEAVRPWLRNAPATRVFNEYGPTEAAVGCCVHEIRPGEETDEISVPIGRPIPGAEVYVLDARREPVPVGMPGELYVGGECLARGYLDSPAETAERFVPHPFSRVPGRRLYRTGDLVCHGSDGALRFLGRIDDQIKIRGVRIEPAEIQAVLRTHPAVGDAVVLARDGRLFAYLMPSKAPAGEPGRVTDSAAVTDAALRAYLAERLPASMVPDVHVWLAAIPLTPNGKVDRKALPSAGGRTGRTAEPADAMEALVLTVFEETLDIAPVGVDEDFFDLGGHSILAVRLIARINEVSGGDLPVSALFDDGEHARDEADRGSATVRHLAGLLRAGAVGERAGCLVPLRGGRAGIPLFCVHPAGGDVLGYRHFVASPALNRPVYALQAPPLEQDGEQDVSSLATRYITEIRSVWPDGPYLLLGWSMGGLVAFEMARRLEALGKRVAMVTLVESYLAAQLPEYDETDNLLWFAGELSALAGTEIVVPPEDLRDSTPRKGVDMVLAAATAAGFVPSEAERSRLVDRFHLNRAHLRAAHGYRPEPYAGPVTLVQAAEQDAALRGEAANAWHALCSRLDKVHVLPGGHFSLLGGACRDALARLATGR